MKEICSKYGTRLSLKYLLEEKENVIFDRKSSKSKPSSLADDISAFANARGGVLAIGISNNGDIEGVSNLSDQQLNDLIEAPKTVCKPMPGYDVEFLPVVNQKGAPDKILLLHIHPAGNYLVRTAKDDTYLRIGDRSVLLKADNLRALEAQKNLQRFEETPCEYATINDLSEKLLNEYKKQINAKETPTERVLSARGMMKNGKLTHAAVLLFAENIRAFYPNCRVRFIRYDGSSAQQGTRLNIIKDQTFEEPIPKLIEKVKKFVSSQLRDFTTLNPHTGKFETTSEYPEFAWLEGIVNAIVHREYAFAGDYIRICMYDDHMVIESPGKLPYPVTIQNIQNTRSSRNPVIARVLTEMGWVRELNEGVQRIFADMAESFLLPPEYKEYDDVQSGTLRLILKNNILVRHARFQDNAKEHIGINAWANLDDLEKSIVTYMTHINNVKTCDLVIHTGYTANTVQRRITNLLKLGIIVSHGKPRSPQRYYSLSAFEKI